MQLVLASASPARHALLLEAGFSPVVIVSGVAEDFRASSTAEIVAELAKRKARHVADQLESGLVIGCDSMLDFEGAALGKPSSAEEARSWWMARRDKSATLFTGHHLIDVEAGTEASEVVGTLVRFGHPDEHEIDAYCATPEALEVAGAFTLAGRAGPFVEEIVGDACSVEGLSLVAFARLTRTLGISFIDLWNRP